METIDEIWGGDLFNRREEAEDLIGYLESVTTRPSIRDEGHAHVLAVDASYGLGKSYFLRRLARHMALEHAVAFVDAWVDDLEDQPMVALVATLDKALEP
ncbi:P-loop NTPase fold protein [uncultured Sphingomonas sp.]|uniref:P-loop NTPase fold protein n=1 Tax=uncultured Sphingomonas sp. TaxID=158754 RepID=UPI0025FDA2AE|nr:P-loop NTPase fold protein [uncultured Sphingomonas sp.]